MTALGVLLRGTRGVPDEGMQGGGAAGIAQKLHLLGELWTFERDGLLHVFSQPASPSDVALARRPRTIPTAPPDGPNPEAAPCGVPSRERQVPSPHF
jgi:hypothetical protein